MARLTLVMVVLVGTLAAQVADDPAARNRFESDLLALSESTSRKVRPRLADDLMSLSESGFRPSPPAVAALADGLARSLAGRRVTAPQASRLASGITEIMRCGGIVPSRFREAIDGTKRDLISIGVNPRDAGQVAELLTIVGNEIRGPEDTPAVIQ